MLKKSILLITGKFAYILNTLGIKIYNQQTKFGYGP